MAIKDDTHKMFTLANEMTTLAAAEALRNLARQLDAEESRRVLSEDEIRATPEYLAIYNAAVEQGFPEETARGMADGAYPHMKR